MAAWNYVVLGVAIVVTASGVWGQADPSFDVVPSATVAAVGHSATIYCTIANVGRNQVFWNIDAAQDITLGPNYNQHSSYPRFQFVGDPTKGQFHLQIANVSSMDEGTYICLVRNPTDETFPVMEAQAELTVISNPMSPPNGNPQCEGTPSSSDGLETGVYMKDDILTLNCTSKGGVPLPQLSWVRVNRDDIEYDLESTMTVIDDVVTSVARITLSSSDNGAFYKCTGAHPVWSPGMKYCMSPFSGTESRLDVRFPPEVDMTPDMVTVEILGVTKATLVCSAKANPPITERPRIILPVNTTHVYPREYDESLVEVELTTDDIGKKFYCIAENTLGVGEDQIDLQRGPFPTWLVLVIIGGISLVLFFFIVVIACACCIDRSELEDDIQKDPNLLGVRAKRSTKRGSLRHEGEDEFLDDGMIAIDNFGGGQENLGAEEDKREEPAGNSDFETGERGPRYQNVNEVMEEVKALDHADDEPLAPYNPEPPVGEVNTIPTDLVD